MSDSTFHFYSYLYISVGMTLVILTGHAIHALFERRNEGRRLKRRKVAKPRSQS